MSAEESDRRDALRAPIELKVEYRRVNAFFADYTRNISRGGTFIGTTRPLPIGTEFAFSLFVPGMTEPLALMGKVVWVTPVDGATPANPPGMGIEFLYRDEEERRDKLRIVRSLFAVELGDALASKIMEEVAPS